VLPLAACGLACDRHPQAQKAGGRRSGRAPTTQVAAKAPTLPTTKPAVPAPEQFASFLYFEYPQANGAAEPAADSAEGYRDGWGQAKKFPPARLRLRTNGDEPVSALLFSDDPKEAINKDWQGDRYYFQLTLPETTDLHKMDGAQWWYQASSERDETPNGVFLKGDRYRLEPTNVRIQFDGTPPHMTVRIAGDFLQYDTTNDKLPPKPVVVRGVLMPRVEAKE
jgi:hypothetical protein